MAWISPNMSDAIVCVYTVYTGLLQFSHLPNSDSNYKDNKIGGTLTKWIRNYRRASISDSNYNVTTLWQDGVDGWEIGTVGETTFEHLLVKNSQFVVSQMTIGHWEIGRVGSKLFSE